jgi:hypothetical protein
VDPRQIVPSSRFIGKCVAIVEVLLFVRSIGFYAIPAMRHGVLSDQLPRDQVCKAIDLAGLKKRKPLCTP